MFGKGRVPRRRSTIARDYPKVSIKTLRILKRLELTRLDDTKSAKESKPDMTTWTNLGTVMIYSASNLPSFYVRPLGWNQAHSKEGFARAPRR
jgi:hypothetical protein